MSAVPGAPLSPPAIVTPLIATVGSVSAPWTPTVTTGPPPLIVVAVGSGAGDGHARVDREAAGERALSEPDPVAVVRGGERVRDRREAARASRVSTHRSFPGADCAPAPSTPAASAAQTMVKNGRALTVASFVG